MQYQLKDFSWSAQYYHPPVQMVMTSANINEEEYHRLENFSMPFGFYYRDKLSFEGKVFLFSSQYTAFKTSVGFNIISVLKPMDSFGTWRKWK